MMSAIQQITDEDLDPVIEVQQYLHNEEITRIQHERMVKCWICWKFYTLKGITLIHTMIMITIGFLWVFKKMNLSEGKSCQLSSIIWIVFLLIHEIIKITIECHSIFKKCCKTLIIVNNKWRRIKIGSYVLLTLLGLSLMSCGGFVICHKESELIILFVFHSFYYITTFVIFCVIFIPKLYNIYQQRKVNQEISRWMDNFSIIHAFEEWIGIESNCVICQEEYQYKNKVRRLNCNHYFHRKCIDQWVTNKQNCPICRQLIDISFDRKSIA